MRRNLVIREVSRLLVLMLFASLGIGQGRRFAFAGGPWYVAPGGQDTNDCRSAATACRTINGAIGKAASGDTINIAAGTYHEVLAILDKNLNFVGVGPAATIVDAAGAQPPPGVPRIALGVQTVVSLTGATLRNGVEGVFVGPGGMVTLTDVTISGNAPGGGIFNGGALTLANATISGNHASADGGGLLNYRQSSATLTNVTISGNTARYRGAGIMNSAALTMTNGVVASNVITDTAGADTPGGGGVFNEGTLVFADGVMSDNTAPSQGGGLANRGTAALSRVTVDGNRGADGGGILNDRVGGTAALTLTNVTISGNSTPLAPNNVGGGLANGTATASLTNVTINGNSASMGGDIYSLGTTRIKNTIVANSPAGGNCFVQNQSLVSLGHNLDSGTSCALASAGDLKNSDPKLGPLASSGGFSPTHALLAGSPAIDSGDNAGCPAADQRGVARPRDGDANGSAICDIGAYERGASDSVFFLPLLRK